MSNNDEKINSINITMSDKIKNNIIAPTTNSLFWMPNNIQTTDKPSTIDNLFKIKNYYFLESNVFNNIYNDINQIKNKEIHDFIIKFTSIFQTTLASYDKLSNYLPPLAINPLDDGSVLIEWIFKDFRIGFSIEPNIDESIWYIVANKKFDEFSMSGVLKLSEATTILKKIINFTLRNT